MARIKDPFLRDLRKQQRKAGKALGKSFWSVFAGFVGFCFAGIGWILGGMGKAFAGLFSHSKASKVSNPSPVQQEQTTTIPAEERYRPKPAWELLNMPELNRKNAAILAPQMLKQAKETADILNNTANPETFFLRYDFLMGRLKIMDECQLYGVSFTGEAPGVTLARLSQKTFRDKTVRAMIDRCFDKTSEKISSLKTEKGKKNAAERFHESFKPYLSVMSEDTQRYQAEQYQRLLRLAEGGSPAAGRLKEKPVPQVNGYGAEAEEIIQQFERLYDLTTEEGIAAIPVSEASHEPGDVVSMPEQILSRKATEYKKAGKLDLAVACLRKANELRGPSFYLYTRDDYERLVDMLIEAGRFEEARAEHKHLDQTLGSREEELRRLQAENCTDEEDRELYEKKVIQPEMEKAKRREQYNWLLENLPDRAPKSFSAYCRMKNQNTATYQKICAAATEKGIDLETVRFWT